MRAALTNYFYDSFDLFHKIIPRLNDRCILAIPRGSNEARIGSLRDKNFHEKMNYTKSKLHGLFIGTKFKKSNQFLSFFQSDIFIKFSILSQHIYFFCQVSYCD